MRPSSRGRPRWGSWLCLALIGLLGAAGSQGPQLPKELAALVDGLRSEADGERFEAYRLLSPRQLQDPMLEGARMALIEALVAVAEEEAPAEMMPGPALAIRLLGEHRAEEAIPVLLEHVEQPFTRLIGSAEEAPTVAAAALIAIGPAVIGPILDRISSASDAEWSILSRVLLRLEVPELLERACRERRGSLSPTGERRLRNLGF